MVLKEIMKRAQPIGRLDATILILEVRLVFACLAQDCVELLVGIHNETSVVDVLISATLMEISNERETGKAYLAFDDETTRAQKIHYVCRGVTGKHTAGRTSPATVVPKRRTERTAQLRANGEVRCAR